MNEELRAKLAEVLALAERDVRGRDIADKLRPLLKEHELSEPSAVSRYASVLSDLRELVAEVDRPPGGMHAEWFHDLSSAKQLPSVVRWARWHLKQAEEVVSPWWPQYIVDGAASVGETPEAMWSAFQEWLREKETKK